MAHNKKPHTRAQGKAAEHHARQFLEKRGLHCVTENFSCRLGEIDLIMQDQAVLVFVEVRYRNRPRYGSAAETVGFIKQAKLVKTAYTYLQRHYSQWPPCRFDVIAVSPQTDLKGYDCHWISNAFQL